jgi:hypothetical protein
MFEDDITKEVTRHEVGPVALATDVIRHAVRTVTNGLFAERDGYGTPESYEAAVESWAWLCGLHAKRLPACVAYAAGGIDTSDAVEACRGRFDKIDARTMRRIDYDAKQCPLWVLPQASRFSLPRELATNEGETR